MTLSSTGSAAHRRSAAIVLTLLLAVGAGLAVHASRSRVSGASASSRIERINHIANSGSASAAETLAQSAANDPDQSVREAALIGLSHCLTPDVRPIIEQALDNPSPGVRAGAAYALAAYSDEPSANRLLDLSLNDSVSRVREGAVTALGRNGHARSIVNLFQIVEKSTDPQVQYLAIKELHKKLGTRYVGAQPSKVKDWPWQTQLVAGWLLQDPMLQNAFAKTGVPLPKSTTGWDPTKVPALKEMVASSGDPIRGRAIFLDRSKVSCTFCHTLEGLGGKVGPELTNLTQTITLDKLIESIIEPSNEIKEGFQAYDLETKEGNRIYGIKVSSDSEKTVLRDTSGNLVTIPANQIQSFEPGKLSIMPEEAVATLKPSDFADMLAFLMNPAAQKTLRSMVTHAFVAGPIAAPIDIENPADAGGDASGSIDTLHGKRNWQPVESDSTRRFNIRAYASPKGTAAISLSVESPKEQAARLWIFDEGRARVTINGSLAFTGEIRQSPIEVKLHTGTNRLVIRVDAPAAESIGILLDAPDVNPDVRK